MGFAACPGHLEKNKCIYSEYAVSMLEVCKAGEEPLSSFKEH